MKKIDLKNKHFVLAFLGIGGLCLLYSIKNSAPKEEIREVAAPASVDTYVPMGMTLVPIELTNAESLSSIVGDIGGVVDLYLPANDERKTVVKVGSRLKLMRAPLNPQQYAILVREDEGLKILKYAGPFTAVVQNPAARGTDLTEKSKKTVRIDYQN